MRNPELTEDGLACVICGLDDTSAEALDVRQVPVGCDAETGAQVFACATCCGEADSAEDDRL